MNSLINTKNHFIPNIWKTNKKGKIYVYEKYWESLLNTIQNTKKFNTTKREISKQINVNVKSLRLWSQGKIKPKLYTQKEFNFNEPNLYWLGLFYSDGHLRNNGSINSHTYQTESSNIFQGYWYPNILQKFSPIYKHKEKKSTVSLRNVNKNSWTFRTNLSGMSPIFIKTLKFNGLIKINKTSGYSKFLTKNFIRTTKNKESLFQGIFDGDGSFYTNNNSFIIDLAIEPNSNFHELIQNFLIVPTLAITNKRKGIMYNLNLKNLYSIRFAPTSICKLNKNIYSASDITNQLEFMLKSAQHSIRPDKVHQLIKIIKRICSKEYGEYNHCLPIQKEIRDLANKKELKEKAKKLEKQYPIKDNKYLPFQPLWTKKLCSKKEWFSKAWNFFFELENLNLKNYPNKEKFNFERGVSVDFKL